MVISTGKENNPCGTGLGKLKESSSSIRELQAGFSKAGKDRRNVQSLQEVDLNFLRHNWEVLRINKLITYKQINQLINKPVSRENCCNY